VFLVKPLVLSLAYSGLLSASPAAFAQHGVPTFHAHGSASPSPVHHPAPNRRAYSRSRLQAVYSHAHLSGAETAGGNLVEPLSNGLRLSSTKAQIIHRLGPTQDDGSYLYYRSFAINYGHAPACIQDISFNDSSNIRLHCGLGFGSPAAAVHRLFGTDKAKTGTQDVLNYGQYQLIFDFDSRGRMDGLTIGRRDYRKPFVPY